MSLDRARQLRQNSTDAERELWLHLRGKRLCRYKFRRQQPVGRYVVDFICHGAKLIVEVDGGQHAEQVDYDAARDAWLRGEGFEVLRFWNNEVLNELEAVLTRILAACEAAHPLPNPSPLEGEGRVGE